jgi:uncharacterized repeat protein (TIGR01451 family)
MDTVSSILRRRGTRPRAPHVTWIRVRRCEILLGAMLGVLGSAVLLLITPLPAHAITWPTTWIGIGACGESEPAGDKTPESADLVGAPGATAAFFQIDSNYLYLRERVFTNPSGPGGFDQYSWVTLIQTIDGDPFKYQWLISLDGGAELLELWRNDPATAQNISFTPIFNDPAETLLFSDTTANLARSVIAGTTIGGQQNYFVDFAIPLSVLSANGIDPGTSLYWFATSANANNFNKDTTACPFVPQTILTLTKVVDPATVAIGATTPVTYTITLTNSGGFLARGVVVSDSDLPSWVTITNVTTTLGSVTSSTSSFEVRIPYVAGGQSVTITVTANATPPSATAFVNTVSAFATNAPSTNASATLTGAVPLPPPSFTDTPSQTPTPTSTPTQTPTLTPTPTPTSVCPALNCDDGIDCTTDSCDPVTGCQHVAKGNGTPCNDGNACTQTDTCQGGSCSGANPVICTALDQCHDVGTCAPGTGVCSNPAKTDGTGCDDASVCTQGDNCQGGICTGATSVTCTPLDECHDSGTCDPITGVCSNPAKLDGTPCPDALACNGVETCQGGVCTAGPLFSCSAFADQCNDASCLEPGRCQVTPKIDGFGCDDGNPCTLNDVCQGGMCVGTNGTDSDGDGYCDLREIAAGCNEHDFFEIPPQPNIYSGGLNPSRGEVLFTFNAPIAKKVYPATDPTCATLGACDGMTRFCTAGKVGDPCLFDSDCNQPPGQCRMVVNYANAPDLIMLYALKKVPKVPKVDIMPSFAPVKPGCSRKVDLTVPLSGYKIARFKFRVKGTTDGKFRGDSDRVLYFEH